MKYRILNDWGTHEGMKWGDEVEYNTVDGAVKAALAQGYYVPFFIVQVINWEAAAKCPYPDCLTVKYKECPVHGEIKS